MPDELCSLEVLQQETTLLPQALPASLGLLGAVRASRGEAAARTAKERMATKVFIFGSWVLGA